MERSKQVSRCLQWRLWKSKAFSEKNKVIGLRKTRPLSGRVFSVKGKIMKNSCQSEGLYTKDRFCYDKENRQLQTEMLTEHPGQTVGKNKAECGKAAGYIKMVGKKMYRVSKVLNNNGVIAINMEENQEYVILGKGVGFGKKVSQRFEEPSDCTRYRLAQETERGSAKELAKSVPPEFLEIADEILREAEKTFGDTIDKGILFPLADHISFAVGRIKKNEQISNPLTDDIKVLFYSEFKVAEVLKKILKERMDIEIDDHEVGYVALHIHSALGDEKVSVAMQTARTVRECIAMIEMATGKKIDVISLSYNRMMNHIKYMVARVSTGETLKLDMNDYIEEKYPESYRIAEDVCESLGKSLGKKLDRIEIGYLAMHIERTVEQ